MDIEFARNIIKDAQKIGIDETEVFLRHSKGLNIAIKNRDIDSVETFQSSGYGIRLIKDKKTGFAYSNKLDNLHEILFKAFQSLKYNEKDEYLCLPESEPSENNKYPLVFDEEIVNLTEDDAIKKVMDIESAALENELVKKTRKASGSFGIGKTIIANSKGVERDYQTTFVSASILLVAEKNGESHTGWDYQSFRMLKDVDFKKIGKNAAEIATMTLGAKKISSFKGLVLMKTPIVVEFLGLLASSFSAEAVQKKRSMLSGKVGQSVISDSIDIIDTAFLDGLVGSRPFDSEGTPTQHNTLVEKGILQGYIHNSYTAKKDGIKSTGNAIRSGYMSTPSVGINNLILKPSAGVDTSKFERLVSLIDRGIYITEVIGMHTANPVSGDFSIGISGIYIEKGESIHPFKEATLSGNILNLFKDIIGIGDDLSFYGNIGTPSILIDGLDICA